MFPPFLVLPQKSGSERMLIFGMERCVFLFCQRTIFPLLPHEHNRGSKALIQTSE